MQRGFSLKTASIYRLAFQRLLWLPVAALSLGSPATYAAAPAATPQVIQAIDEGNRATLRGNLRRETQAGKDLGVMDDAHALPHLWLQLKRSPEREQALEQRIDAMQTPGSPLYHQWLSAEELGRDYGPAPQDIAAVSRWLAVHGFTVNAVYPSAMLVDFSGNARMVRGAFGTELHRYQVNGVQHYANAAEPSIPQALAAVVAGPVGLDDFRPHSTVHKTVTPSLPSAGNPSTDVTFQTNPGYGLDTLYLVGPEDFNIIYNVTPTWSAGYRGAGQTIAILQDSDVQTADWTTFRHSFGLDSYAGTLTIEHPSSAAFNCTDPATDLYGWADEEEAALDVEWSGALAPDAKIILAACDTGVNFGALIAAQNLLNSGSPPQIMSLSFSAGEQTMGSAQRTLVANLWQQAAAEGVSVFVSSGDNGPDTDAYGQAYSTDIDVNGLASTPNNVAVGGTDFMDVVLEETIEPGVTPGVYFTQPSTSTFWSQASLPAAYSSVLGYVPEMAWDNSCASWYYTGLYYNSNNTVATCNAGNQLNTVAGGGGASAYYSKPAWQVGIYGMPNDGMRDLPDVSFFSANGTFFHSLIFCMSDTGHGGQPCDYTNVIDMRANTAGGTSFAAPAMAGIDALINQAAGGAGQGNVANLLYGLNLSAFGTAANPNYDTINACNGSNSLNPAASCLFNDITQGTIAIPCALAGPDCTSNGNALPSTGPCTGPCGVTSVYMAGRGWDFATGLGSMNVSNVVQAIKNLPVISVAASFYPTKEVYDGSAGSRMTVTLTNANAFPITGVNFLEQLVYGLSADGVETNSCGGSAVSGGNFAYSGGTIPANGSCSIVIDISANNTGVWTVSTGPVLSANALANRGASANFAVMPQKQWCPPKLGTCM